MSRAASHDGVRAHVIDAVCLRDVGDCDPVSEAQLVSEALSDALEHAGGLLLDAAKLGAMVREPREDRLLQLLGQLLHLEAQRRALTLCCLGALCLLEQHDVLRLEHFPAQLRLAGLGLGRVIRD